MKFATKLTIVILGIVVTFAAIVSYFVYTSNVKTLKDQIRDRLEDTAFHTMDKVDRMLYERFADIKIIASDPVISFSGSAPRQITERLLEYRNCYKTYISLTFFDLNRVTIADTSGLDIGKRHPLEGYWKEIMMGKGFVMDVSESLMLRRTVIHFAFPVKDKNGKTFGVVVSRMPINKLYYVIKGAGGIQKEPEGLKIDLIDEAGLLLFSNYDRKGILKDNYSHRAFAKKAMAGAKTGSSIHYDLLSKEKELCVFVREQGYLDFKGNNWSLLMGIPTKVALAPAVKQRNVMLFIVAVALAFSTIVIWFFSRSVSKPIIKLQEAARSIGAGILDHRIDLDTKDEVGMLAESFNEMAAKLKESYAGLELKVKERTAELEEAKGNLEIKVAERTKELQERLTELERYQEATVDRELRMKELRDKIEGLEGRLKEK